MTDNETQVSYDKLNLGLERFIRDVNDLKIFGEIAVMNMENPLEESYRGSSIISEVPGYLKGLHRFVNASIEGFFIDISGHLINVELPEESMITYREDLLIIHHPGYRDLTSEEWLMLRRWECELEDCKDALNSCAGLPPLKKGYEYLFGLKRQNGLLYHPRKMKVSDYFEKGAYKLMFFLHKDKRI